MVLLLWIYVIYNRSLRIAAFLGVLFTAEALSVFIILGRSLRDITGMWKRYHIVSMMITITNNAVLVSRYNPYSWNNVLRP